MELYYIFIILSVLTRASSTPFEVISHNTIQEFPKSLPLVKEEMDGHKSHFSTTVPSSTVALPIYSLYLIGFTYFFLVMVIIGLSGALYFALKKKSIIRINTSNKQYVRQESTGVQPLYSASYDEENKNNGSTLTVNSGIIEISEPKSSNPTTPTRIEDSKIIFAKKPLKPIVPVMHRGQMDAICKEVLKKVAKSDSACYRDLNDLLKFENKEDNFSMKSEDIKEKQNEFKTEFEAQLLKLKKTEIKKETENVIITETQNAIKSEHKEETKQETQRETTSQTKTDENKDVRIEVDNVESDKNEDDSDSQTEYDTVPSPIRFRHSGPEPEQTMYDTVPNPMRFRHSGPEPEQTMYDTVPNSTKAIHSGPEPDQCMYDTVASPKKIRNSDADTDDGLNDIPFYDLPPMRSQEGLSKNVILMDPDSHYLVPLSTEKTDSCYINAKKQSFTAPKS